MARTRSRPSSMTKYFQRTMPDRGADEAPEGAQALPEHEDASTGASRPRPSDKRASRARARARTPDEHPRHERVELDEVPAEMRARRVVIAVPSRTPVATRTPNGCSGSGPMWPSGMWMYGIMKRARHVYRIPGRAHGPVAACRSYFWRGPTTSMKSTSPGLRAHAHRDGPAVARTDEDLALAGGAPRSGTPGSVASKAPGQDVRHRRARRGRGRCGAVRDRARARAGPRSRGRTGPPPGRAPATTRPLSRTSWSRRVERTRLRALGRGKDEEELVVVACARGRAPRRAAPPRAARPPGPEAASRAARPTSRDRRAPRRRRG